MLFDHTRRWRASPHEGLLNAGDTAESANMKADAHHSRTHSFEHSEYERMIVTPNDIRGPRGPKAS